MHAHVALTQAIVMLSVLPFACLGHPDQVQLCCDCVPVESHEHELPPCSAHGTVVSALRMGEVSLGSCVLSEATDWLSNTTKHCLMVAESDLCGLRCIFSNTARLLPEVRPVRALRMQPSSLAPALPGSQHRRRGKSCGPSSGWRHRVTRAPLAPGVALSDEHTGL